MKQFIFIVAILFTSLSFSSNVDFDIGADDQTTTIEMEAIKHQSMINEGWKFEVMTIKEDSKGIFLVINYSSQNLLKRYCSKYIRNFPERYKPGKSDQVPKLPKDNFKQMIANSSGGNPGWCV
jgi:hypothetical protein